MSAAPANDPATAGFEKGKGKATDPANEVSMDEDSESESENEEQPAEEEDNDGNDLEPIDESNIITGGRRTRGKVIDYAQVAAQNDDMDEEEDDDEDFQARDDDDDQEMRG